MMEAGLHDYLTKDNGVKAIVGTRVYPVYLPQSPTYPAITYQRITTERVGSTTGPSGLARPRFQVDCWATTYAGAKALSTAVRTAVDGHSGKIGSADVFGVIVSNETDFYEPDVDINRVTMDLIIWHKE